MNNIMIEEQEHLDLTKKTLIERKNIIKRNCRKFQEDIQNMNY